MARFQLRVKVVKKHETVEFESGFKKRYLDGIIEGEFPQEYQFEFTKDNVALVDEVEVDQYVTVNFNVRSRKVTEDKEGIELAEPLYFVSLNGWKLEK